MPDTVRTERSDSVATICLDRPERRNAIDSATADALADAVRAADAAPDVAAIVLTGAGAHFCAGADLQALAAGEVPDVGPAADGPLGPTRLHPDTPTIAAVEGYAVAGGLELACWCDLRIVAADAVFGVFNRRYGIPLVDGGTQRLPRIVGLGRALDLILTGRPVDAEEAKDMGLATRVVASGAARADAEALAHRLAEVPQAGLRSDRAAVYEGLGTPIDEGLRAEARRGQTVADDVDLEAAARRFGDDPSDGPEAKTKSE